MTHTATIAIKKARSGMLAIAKIEAGMKNRVRKLRQEKEMTQAELAIRLGVSRQTVNAIETGKYNPSLPLAFEISRVFGLKIEEIFNL